VKAPVTIPLEEKRNSAIRALGADRGSPTLVCLIVLCFALLTFAKVRLPFASFGFAPAIHCTSLRLGRFPFDKVTGRTDSTVRVRLSRGGRIRASSRLRVAPPGTGLHRPPPYPPQARARFHRRISPRAADDEIAT
jgi:hypothetical protein